MNRVLENIATLQHCNIVSLQHCIIETLIIHAIISKENKTISV